MAYYSSAFLLKARKILSPHVCQLFRQLASYFLLNCLYFIVLAEDDDGKTGEVSTHAPESCFQSTAGKQLSFGIFTHFHSIMLSQGEDTQLSFGIFTLQSNNEKLLENPYLQMRGILQLANDLGIELWPRDIEYSKVQTVFSIKKGN